MGVEIIDKDRGWKAMMARVKHIGEKRVHVGVLSDPKSGGLHVPGADLTVAEIAAVNEFGSKDGRIPERSFLRSTFDEERERLAELAKKLLGGVLDGRLTADRALGLLGADLAAKVKMKITSGAGVPPPNAPSVAARKQARGKGAIRTLVDTGRMLGAITWAIISGDRE